jgi:hypothetical protein
MPFMSKKYIVSSSNAHILPKGNAFLYLRSNDEKHEIVFNNFSGAKKGDIVAYKFRTDKIDNEKGALIAIEKVKPYRLAIVYSKNGEQVMQIGSLNSSNKLNISKQFYLEDIDGIQSISFSYKPNIIVLSAYSHGQTDIYEFNIKSNKLTQITDNYYDENNAAPFEIENEKGYLFTSNSSSDSFFHKNIELKKLDYQKLFFIDDESIEQIKNHNITYFATSLHTMDSSSISNITQGGNNTITFLSDRNGIENLHEVNIQHGIFEKSRQLTNFSSSLVSKQMKEDGNSIYVSKQLDSLYIFQNKVIDSSVINNTIFKDELNEKSISIKLKQDSLLSKKPKQGVSLFNPFRADSTERAKYKDSLAKEKVFDIEKARPYVIQLTSDYLSAQLDNSLLINRYQPYQLNQGQFHQQVLSGMAKYSFSDIFEDYKATVGFRIPSNSRGGDFFIEFDNFKKHLDWGFSYIRHVEKFSLPNDTNWANQFGYNVPNYIKQKTHYFEARALYPFSKHNAIKLTGGIRKDQQVYIATDKFSLTYPNNNQLWILARFEWALNKLKFESHSFMKGYQVKLFLEYQNEVAGSKNSFFHIGGVGTYYKPIYKQITWANRIQSALSGGESEGVMYVLGGVQNQLAPIVDSSVKFSQKDNYSFISYASSLRGYAQNIRSGNILALVNSEIRVPILPLFFNHTTALTSLNKLQALLFTDIGNAWKLYSPIQKWALGYGVGLRTVLVSYFVRVDCAWRNLSQVHMKNPIVHVAIGREW